MNNSEFVSSSSKLVRSRSDGPFLYIFMLITGSSDAILYRIDALKHLPHNNNTKQPSSSTNLYDLQPLLVFPEPVLPTNCVCVKLESNFYFLKTWQSQTEFEFDDSEPTDVYMIRESDLMHIVPSEHNTNGKNYLIKTASMNGSKHIATVFVAENMIYVLSCLPSDTQFEVFDPRRMTWKVLPQQPEGYVGCVSCYVVVGKTVYFNMLFGDALLYFHLEDEKWGIFTHDISVVPPRHSFHTFHPLVVTGDMGFGLVYDDKCEDDITRDDSLTICATPLPHVRNFISHEFIRPSIPLDDEFLAVLNSCRCPHVTVKYDDFSDYIVALDGGKVLCLISYGGGPLPEDDWRVVDPYKSYVTLNFFEVTCDVSYVARRCFKARKVTRPKGRDVDYVARRYFKAKKVTPRRGHACTGYNVARRYFKAKKASSRRGRAYNVDHVAGKCFKAKLLHTVNFVIKTTSLRTCGRIEACFAEGL